MTLSSSSSSSSKIALSPPPVPRRSHHFTPIQECEGEEHEDGDEFGEFSNDSRRTTPGGFTDKREVETTTHQATPLHLPENRAKASKKRTGSDGGGGGGEEKEDDRGVNCNKCRPSNREKITVVPVDHAGCTASPNGLFKSILGTLTKKSPRTVAGPPERVTEEQWKLAVAELSHKLIHASRKRDEAVSEASRLKHSVAELEKKLNKLEIHCRNLNSGLEICTNQSNSNSNSPSPYRSSTNLPKINPQAAIAIGDHGKVIEHFLVLVSESRSSLRHLSRSLTLQFRQAGGAKVYDRISSLLQPYEIKLSLSKNPRPLVVYLEALLNKAFFEDFESVGFQRNSPNPILNPTRRCEFNFASFNHLSGLTWDEVLNKGTKHFSDEFSRFCDRKMSEIVAMLGWNRAWPEPLLQAFFGASKSVWLVHLLANSVHPGLPIFKVDKGLRFDPVYMEDMGAEKAPKLVSGVVGIMVTPGFYVYGSVIKCKVMCRYHNNINNHHRGGGGYESSRSEKGLTASPVSPI